MVKVAHGQVQPIKQWRDADNPG